MFNGPYGSPPALGRHPALCALWVTAGVTGTFMLAGALIGGLFPDMFVTIENGERVNNDATINLFGCVIMAAIFAGVSVWSRSIGAGAFAGSMRVSPFWLAFAVAMSPVFWMVLTLVAGVIMGGGDWVFRSPEDAAAMDSATWTLPVFFMAILISPLVEEVLYRGVGFGCLAARGWPPALAIALPNVIFALSHTQYSAAAITVVFLGGFWFGFLRVQTGSMAAPIAGHIAINATLLYLSSL